MNSPFVEALAAVLLGISVPSPNAPHPTHTQEDVVLDQTEVAGQGDTRDSKRLAAAPEILGPKASSVQTSLSSNQMTAKDVATLTIALVGAVLGVTNFIRELLHRRPRLCVELTPATLRGEQVFFTAKDVFPDSHMAVRVTNLCNFPLTLSSITGKFKRRGMHAPIYAPRLSNGGSLPARLEPRTSVCAFIAPQSLDRLPDPIDRIEVETECGYRMSASTIVRQRFNDCSSERRRGLVV